MQVCLLLATFFFPYQLAPTATQSSSRSAFVHVALIPMAREQVLSHQTILVRGSRVAEITSARQAKIPESCSVIDGRHRYLMPGLVDSHVHLPLTGRADQLLVLQMLLANGVTTAINMEGSAEILGVRDEIRAGKLTGPAIYTTGVFIQQPAFSTAEQFRNEVIAEKAAGYDFVKMHGELTKEAHDALFETAQTQHIRVVGHVPSNLGIEAALGRQSLIGRVEEWRHAP